MEIMGLTLEEILSVLKIVASVLKLGNISFIPSNNIDGTEGCTVSNDYGLCNGCAEPGAGGGCLGFGLA